MRASSPRGQREPSCWRIVPNRVHPGRARGDREWPWAFPSEGSPPPDGGRPERAGFLPKSTALAISRSLRCIRAVKTGLEHSGTDGMTLADLIPRLEELMEQKGTVGQSAASVVSKLRPFIDQEPFGEEDPESWERLFTGLTHRCHIVQLAGFMKDAARLVTEFSLIDLYWFYRSRGTQHCPRVIVLDEVQNLDHREESPLAQLLREGRKFGFSLILATQIMSNPRKR